MGCITDIVTKCNNPECDFVKVPKDRQEMVAMLQLQEWGCFEDTKCDKCGKVGTLKVETACGIPVTSKFGDDFIIFK